MLQSERIKTALESMNGVLSEIRKGYVDDGCLQDAVDLQGVVNSIVWTIERSLTREKLLSYDHEPKIENCKTCKHYTLCGVTYGCKKRYDEHRGFFIGWPSMAWCEDWEKSARR